jgi:DNA (cytosine-5)-methyltransferase 1
MFTYRIDMNYLSVCSGIEAATVAWHDMGWNPVGFSEIEKFPSQLLAHHYPNVTNYGDMTKFKEWNINEPVNLLVGGTPCQSFSVAGLRKGLDDPRGNLMLTYLAMADHFKPKWLLWENVPGVLSSNRGHDFAALLQGLAQLGYGFAYRVLDAQHFGVPQRRRRVFVVGCLGDWRSAAKVLFESESLCRNITPSREKRKEVTEIAGTLTSNGGGLNRPAGNANELDFCVATTCSGKETFGTLMANCGTKLWLGNQEALSGDYHVFGDKLAVRRLTPLECERLQGFSDNYTNTPTSSDTVRYKALGNSMAVPVMKWIGKRINELS